MISTIHKRLEKHFFDQAGNDFVPTFANVPSEPTNRFYRVEILPFDRDYGTYAGERIRGQVQVSIFAPTEEGLLNTNEFIDTLFTNTDGLLFDVDGGSLQISRGQTTFSGIDRGNTNLYQTRLRWNYEVNK